MMATRTAPRTPRNQPPRQRRPAWSPVPCLVFYGAALLWIGAATGTGLLFLVGVAAIVTAAAWGIRALSRWLPVLLAIYVVLAAIKVAEVLMAVHR
jgi:hypothetical protein